MTDLSALLADLDALAASYDHGDEAVLAGRAAKAIREMARDFDEYADHGLNDRGENCERAELGGRCGCGLDSARARWGVK
jgi:hypothetical protein